MPAPNAAPPITVEWSSRPDAARRRRLIQLLLPVDAPADADEPSVDAEAA